MVRARIAATAASSVRFGRCSAVSSEALNERLTRMRLTITTTSERNASARTSCSGMPDLVIPVFAPSGVVPATIGYCAWGCFPYFEAALHPAHFDALRHVNMCAGLAA